MKGCNSSCRTAETLDVAERKVLAADQAARDILDGVERNRFRVLVGSDAKFLDALYRMAPKRAAAFISKQMKDLLT